MEHNRLPERARRHARAEAALEWKVEQRRYLEHLMACRRVGCLTCESTAPRAVHSMFFDTPYDDPLAA